MATHHLLFVPHLVTLPFKFYLRTQLQKHRSSSWDRIILWAKGSCSSYVTFLIFNLQLWQARWVAWTNWIKFYIFGMLERYFMPCPLGDLLWQGKLYLFCHLIEILLIFSSKNGSVLDTNKGVLFSVCKLYLFCYLIEILLIFLSKMGSGYAGYK